MIHFHLLLTVLVGLQFSPAERAFLVESVIQNNRWKTPLKYFEGKLYKYVLPSSAQAPVQLYWAELVLILKYPASARTSSEIAGNQQNMLCNICRTSPVESKTVFSDYKAKNVEFT
jgi:hypothetical protein